MPSRDTLTAAQTRVQQLLFSNFASLEAPTVVVLEGPSGRGKTRVVQSFYDRLVAGQSADRRFWRGQLATDAVPDWRRSRKNVEMPAVDATQEPTWLWLGVNGYPKGGADTRRVVGRIGQDIVAAFEADSLPTGAKSKLQRGAARTIGLEILGLLGSAATELLPASGLVLDAGKTIRGIQQAIEGRTNLAVPLPGQTPDQVALDVLILSLASSIIAESSSPLVPIIIAVDDAQMLTPNDVAILDAIVASNPERDLLESGLLSGAQRSFAASKGLPSVAPVLLIATRQELPEEEPDVFGVQTYLWSESGVAVFSADYAELPPISKPEGIHIAGGRMHSHGLSDDQLDAIVEHAIDRVNGELNATLLLAHCERINGLSAPNQVVDWQWCKKHLPRYVEDDARLRFEELAREQQDIVVAGSLRGTVFAKESAAEIMGVSTLADSALAGLGPSKYVYHVTDPTGEFQYAFADEAAYAYARKRAVTDPVLCTRALIDVSAPLISSLWQHATVGPLGDGRMMYEFSRREAAEFASLVDEAGIDGASLNPEIWMGALGFGSERQHIQESFEPNGPSHMAGLLRFMSTGSEPLDGEGYVIAARWAVHRSLPGLMTFRTVWGQPPEASLGSPRLKSSAPRDAAKVAGRVLPTLLERRMLLEPELRLLLRLSVAGEKLKSKVRALVASRLLEVAPLRLSAAALLARVYARDLGRQGRSQLRQILLEGPSDDRTEYEERRALALAWLGLSHIESAGALVIEPLIRCLDNAATRGSLEGTFSVTGRFADVSDPFVYPWAHLPVYAAAALVTDATVTGTPRQRAIEFLCTQRESHPGAAWLAWSVGSEVPVPSRAAVREAVDAWKTRGALDAGRFDLLGTSKN